MLANLKNSLENLEDSFKKNSSLVKKASLEIEKNLEEIKRSTNKNETNSDALKDLLPLIEKLSIQNEFKLSVIKEFPQYILNKK